MKITAILFTVLLTLSNFVFSQNADLFSDLQKKNDGKFYSKHTGSLYTGAAYGKHKNGQFGMKGKLLNGNFDGTWTWWYSEGVKKRETNYIDGQKEGNSYWWYKNGIKKLEVIFASNKNIGQKRWDEKGNRLPNPKMGRR